MGHRTVMKTLAVMLLVGLVMGGTALAADTIKVGLVTHKSGPLVAASKVTGFPAAKLWVSKVNERGGLKVDGTRKKIELIVYDDKTNPAEHIKAVQRLATRDKVDFMVAPMGTGFNLAAAPIYAKYNYPLLAVSAVTDKMAELSKRYPSMFFTLGTTTSFVEGALQTLEKLRKDGVIGSRVAMEETLDKALRRVLWIESGQPKEVSPKIAESEEISDFGALALKYYNNAKEYLREGDWAGYGRELEKLENILNRLANTAGDKE